MKLYRCAIALMLGCAAGLLAGCGTPSQSLNMALPAGEALQLRGFMPEPLRGQVMLETVRGGNETSVWWGSRVSSLSLQNALEDSLRAVGLWAMSQQGARYQLQAELLSLVQPLVALDTTVTATVHYRLLEAGSGKMLYERSVRAAYKAEFGDAMLSQPERLRLANEGAVRQTVNLMLRDLPNLPL